MNMVKVFIKGQEDKELISFLRYYPARIKNVGIDGVFDRQTIFDFKDGCNQPQVAQFVAKELVRKFGRKIGKVVFSCVPAERRQRCAAARPRKDRCLEPRGHGQRNATFRDVHR